MNNMICQNHDGEPCSNEATHNWNVRTLNTKQILRVALCDKHVEGEDYS